MKKGMTMEQYMAELEAKKKRAEVFADIIRYIDNEINWKCDRIVEKESYYEAYTDEEGNEKKRFHCAEYKLDDDGNEIRIPPEEGSYNYDTYTMLNIVKDEILAII